MPLGSFDKVILKFIADILYLKGILYSDELEDIYDAKTPFDLDTITNKMFSEDYSPYKRGEGYVRTSE